MSEHTEVATAVVDEPTPVKFTSRNLRVVESKSPDYDGGFTVEHGDQIVAGPYASKVDAKQAKLDLIAGKTVKPDSGFAQSAPESAESAPETPAVTDETPESAESAESAETRSAVPAQLAQTTRELLIGAGLPRVGSATVAKLLDELSIDAQSAPTDEQRERANPSNKRSAAVLALKGKSLAAWVLTGELPAASTTTSTSTTPRAQRGDETQINAAAEQLTAVESQLKQKPGDETLIAQRDQLIVSLITLNAGYTFIAKTRGVATSTNRGLCRVLMGGKRL